MVNYTLVFIEKGIFKDRLRTVVFIFNFKIIQIINMGLYEGEKMGFL